MIGRGPSKENRRTIQYTLFIFIVFAAAYLSIALLIENSSDQIHKQEMETHEHSLVDVEQAIISNKVNRLVSDVLYISDSLLLSDAFGGGYSELEQHWLAFSNRKRIYDQIRYIDADGNEIIRVNYDSVGAYLVEESELQNKKDRYYFTDSITLKENEIYISKLDLNIENQKIEQPVKPMIRLSTPYYDNSGKLRGIVVLNYSANDMLQQVQKIASTSQGSIYMLNSDGYWTFDSGNSDNSWAFMYEDKQNVSFAREYPEEWETIKSVGKGSLLTQNGNFIFTNILLNSEFSLDSSGNSLVLGQGDWYIVSHVSPDTENGKLYNRSLVDSIINVFKRNFPVYLLILLAAFILAAFITANKNKKEELEYFSEYDTMTGVYNRRAGFEKLNELYKSISNVFCKISICFIDINGLKEVNDTLGHEAGDELIRSVVGEIKKSIRGNDFVARLGGDEFLIIFEGLDEENVESIWKRIVQKYEQINSNENRKYMVSVSHGVETLTCSVHENVDAVINRADEKMYAEKRLIKKDLIVIR